MGARFDHNAPGAKQTIGADTIDSPALLTLNIILSISGWGLEQSLFFVCLYWRASGRQHTCRGYDDQAHLA